MSVFFIHNHNIMKSWWAHIMYKLLFSNDIYMSTYNYNIPTCICSPTLSVSSGTIYRAGTVCFVENGPYVALIETGWFACTTVKRLNDNTESWFSFVIDGVFLRSDNVFGDCTVECLKKKPLSGFSKLTWTELVKSRMLEKRNTKGLRKINLYWWEI